MLPGRWSQKSASVIEALPCLFFFALSWQRLVARTLRRSFLPERLVAMTAHAGHAARPRSQRGIAARGPVVVLALSALAAACARPAGAVHGEPARPSAAVAVRLDIARAEAERERGVARLAVIASSNAAAETGTTGSAGAADEQRRLAIRALGRIGGDQAIAALLALLDRDDARLTPDVAWALGIAGATTAEERLRALFARAGTDVRVRAAVLGALGRVGGQAALPTLTQALGERALVEPAALALGWLGRRQIALDPPARRALVQAGRDAALPPEPGSEPARLAVAFALAREHAPPDDADVIALLITLSRRQRHAAGTPPSDASTGNTGSIAGEIRAMALRALVTRDGGGMAFADALDDPDWRVRVEAVRGLARPGAGQDDHLALVGFVAREWTLLGDAGYAGPHAHVVLEGLRGLMKSAPSEPDVVAVAGLFASGAAEAMNTASSPHAIVVASTAHCLATALQVKESGSAGLAPLLACGGARDRGMPVHERVALAAEIAASDPGSSLSYMRAWLADRDARVRAAAVVALGQAIPSSHGQEWAAPYRELLRAALGDPAVEVTGSAADVLVTLAKSEDGRNHDLASGLAAELLAAAQRSTSNLELTITFLAAVAAVRPDQGEALCNQLHGHANRSVRAAARACLRAYQGQDSAPDHDTGSASPATLPPADPASVLGKRVTLFIDTSAGAIVVALDPGAAPWHVAAIASLVARGFYSGLLWHRVVPDFVVQGGDPSGSGWGGPDFVIPAEPSRARYRAGTVGIADAGLDTGGSQWFLMHSAAPHLDGRYTVIGQVSQGQDVVDSLVVGDRILAARIVLE